MVDARDLKSLGGKPLCRFESGRPHHGINDLSGHSLLRAAASNAHVGTVSACAVLGFDGNSSFVTGDVHRSSMPSSKMRSDSAYGARVALTFVPG